MRRGVWIQEGFFHLSFSAASLAHLRWFPAPRKPIGVTGRVRITHRDPFARDRLDLARYYAIRLAMEGLGNEIIAGFLRVELRTLGNYVAEAKERIRLTLESR